MIYKKILWCALAILTFGCSEKKIGAKEVEQKPAILSQPTDTILSAKEKKETNVPANVDDRFETFLQYFNQNKDFQLSRIEFPIKAKVLDENSEAVERLIDKNGYNKLDFTYDEAAKQEYKQEISVNKNNATIEVQGIENGIAATYYFEKIKGKWMLISFEDYST